MTARSCPFCAAAMNEDATLCAACGRFSVSAASSPAATRAAVSPAPIDRLNVALGRWEAASPLAQRLRRGADLPTFALSPAVRIAVGAMVLAYGVGLLVLWLGPQRNFYAARYGVGAVVVGLALLLYGRLLKPARDMEQAGPAPANLPAIRFLGRDSNLLAVQLLAMAHLVDRAYWQDADAARTAAVVVIAVAFVLYPSRVRLGPILLAAAAAAYVVVITSAMSNFAFRQEMDTAHIVEDDLVVPLWLVFWTVAAAAVFPQLQLIRWGRLRLGAVRGDVVVDRGGNPVLLAFGSAALIAAVATMLYSLNYAWHWLSLMVG